MHHLIHRPAVLALGLTAALVAAPASADGNGFWLGLGVGWTDPENTCDDLRAAGFTECDDDLVGWKLHGGLDLHENFAFELALANYGEAEASSPGLAADVAVKAITMAAMGRIEVVPALTLFGKLGVARWDVDVDTSLGNDTDDGVDPMFGLGVEWRVAQRVGVRAEWERLLDVGGGSGSEGGDLDFFSVGVVYHF